ncbi:glycine cleavage system protein GcvH [Gammaproteobacteria bacterium]|jgi:glycine cleavage system H protein|nr:glycine cleavage system protein GcvH [Gammaproteobacteria bacterium]MDC0028280.1 glycine cleavage system protein GcvH [Gammaproteobacteria bacterium]|tara:strand:- start:93 stop:479 length:387 start_codon:yes stop_codon:yes gene_type:complete
MSESPENLKYLSSHEWVKLEDDGSVTVGISDHAQDLLGDIVFVELPEVGQELGAEEEAAVVESVKAASDIFSPIGGKVTEINEKLLDEPDLVNVSPYEDGWFFKMQPDDLESLKSLLSSEEYTNSQES